MSHPLFVLLAGCGGSPDAADTASSAPPQVYLLSPKAGDALPAGESIELRAIVSDDVDEPTDLKVVVWLGDGTALTSGHPDKLGQLNLMASIPEGAQTLVFEVEDTEHHTANASVDVYSSPHTFDAPVVALSPEAAVTGEALAVTIVADAIPGDGHLVDYQYRWTLEGEPTEWADAAIPAGVVMAGEAWAVAVVGRSETSESPAAKASVVIGNAPPSLGNAVVEASEDATTVTCAHAEILDAEGDPLTIRYLWTLDDAWVTATEASIPTPVGPRGAAVGCTISVGDGTQTVTTTALPWALPNHPPSLGTVEVYPSVATVETPLACTFPEGVDDVDGDEVTVNVAWFVNDEPASGDASGLLTGGTRGDAVSCEVTADDGFSGTAVALSPAVILDNSAPSAPEVRVTPEAPTTGDMLGCGVTVPGTDADGDVLRCDTRWDVGLPAGEGPQFDTQGLPAATEVTCVVTCFDGITTGKGGVATVTLAAPISGTGSAGDAMVQIDGTTADGRFGSLVVALPDLDGDGRADLGIGAPGVGVGGTFYVFPAATLLGAESLTASDAAGSWLGDDTDDNVGSFGSVAAAGDQDGDGDGDVLVAAPWSDVTGHDAGQAYVVYGGAGLATDVSLGAAGIWSVGGEPGDWLGSRVAGGDLDGDGLADLVVAGPASDLGGAHSGVVAVLYGDAARRSGVMDLSDADAIVVGGAGEQLGWGLAVCADADGDGTAELAVGASRATASGLSDAGWVGLASGTSLGTFDTFEAVTWLRIAGEQAGDRVGASVACPGDLDDDGLGELVFGAPRHDTTLLDAGQVAIFFGRTDGDGGLVTSDADAVLSGDAANDQLGGVVASAGDLDHDGLADLLVGAPGATAAAGLVDVLLASTAGDWSPSRVTPDATIAGNAMTDRIGEALAGGLDLEGDGFGEIALGAAHADATITEGGAVYVFSGHAAMR